MRILWMVVPAIALMGCRDDGSSDGDGEGLDVTDSAVDDIFSETGAWESGIPDPEETFYVRPPGETYGQGDGSSWENAFSGLPETRMRGARYLFAAGEYHPESLDRIETYILDDSEDGEAYIELFKATADAHGDETGWDPKFAEGPAELGALSFVTGYYVIDGMTGTGVEGYGFYIHHRDCSIRETDFVASPIFFPWNSETSNLAIRHTEIADCGSHDDPTVRSQDAIYAVEGPSRVVFRGNYIRDSWRNHLFLQGSEDILIEDSRFERAGIHHEANSLAFRDSRNIVIRRNFIKDSINAFVSLQTVRNVTISANVLTRELDDWDNWAGIFSQEPAYNVLIAGNTFANLVGLNVGIRFTANTENLSVVNNLWAGNSANQIMLNGEHRNNAFYENYRVDGDSPVSLRDTIDEETAVFIDTDPFSDAASFDFSLIVGIESGEPLDEPFVNTDNAGNLRTRWDRGAFEFVE